MSRLKEVWAKFYAWRKSGTFTYLLAGADVVGDRWSAIGKWVCGLNREEMELVGRWVNGHHLSYVASGQWLKKLSSEQLKLYRFANDKIGVASHWSKLVEEDSDARPVNVSDVVVPVIRVTENVIASVLVGSFDSTLSPKLSEGFDEVVRLVDESRHDLGFFEFAQSLSHNFHGSVEDLVMAYRATVGQVRSET